MNQDNISELRACPVIIRCPFMETCFKHLPDSSTWKNEFQKLKQNRNNLIVQLQISKGSHCQGIVCHQSMTSWWLLKINQDNLSGLRACPVIIRCPLMETCFQTPPPLTTINTGNIPSSVLHCTNTNHNPHSFFISSVWSQPQTQCKSKMMMEVTSVMNCWSF